MSSFTFALQPDTVIVRVIWIIEFTVSESQGRIPAKFHLHSTTALFIT